ncbi:hypothetical protein BJ138DRAFT_1142258 [Hygrophoropsis aurantiaca]|uniref:Uncharacterized protein n=1 Tax=Hygrophoropsis aurantiaca TaxID=72124 RepID=A0ACB8AR02_9AGAM|nr:hypothetical protein BJ138DRAFT_1142258 [Hygrophoropsis aurantiaca]
MTVKRKCAFEDEDYSHQTVKQLKMIPFPHYEPDFDVTMNESPSSDAEQFNFPGNHHTRLASTASNSSNSSGLSDHIDYNSPLYPRFQLYQPVPESYAEVDPAHNASLLQPASTFSHHGMGCSQIPKLRVAQSVGANGQRTMWSFCEQCGAISMVDTH